MIFGPRKLPEMMRKIGKVTAEFKKTTNDFKDSWEKEVSLEIDEEDKKLLEEKTPDSGNTISREDPVLEEWEDPLTPEIKEIDQEAFDLHFTEHEEVTDIQSEEKTIEKPVEEEKIEVNEVKEDIMDKRDWF